MMNFREARNELTINLKAEISKVIERKKADANYYILVASQVNNFDSNRIDNKLILYPEGKQPTMPIIGTILYHVDNRRGKLKRMWVFPRDVMQPESMINTAGDYSDEIFHLGKAPDR